MKIKDKKLARALEKVHQEVSKWPKWKRSIDIKELERMNRGQ